MKSPKPASLNGGRGWYLIFAIGLAPYVMMAQIQATKPVAAAKTTQSKTTQSKATKSKTTKAKPVPAVTFEAHNEGSVEGPIYGDENLVSVTIDSAGIHYRSKSADKPVTIPWDQVSGWQANNFTSRSPGRTTNGDYGIGVNQGAKYLSFRTKNGRDFLAAMKALRAAAGAKEHPGIG